MTLNRIQSYLRENVRLNSQVVELPPFTLFFHPSDPLKYFNYAIPDRPVVDGEDISKLSATLGMLRAAFHQRGRVARFEFYEEFAPALPALLRANGFIEEGRQWSMVCTPATFHIAPEVNGLEIIALRADSPAEDIHDFLLAQRQGFNPANISEPSEADVRQARADFGERGWQAFLGRIGGEPAGVSVFGRPLSGISEVAGIATRVPFRRQGIAARLTVEAVQTAFARGVKTACLTAEDEVAGRVYERVGFRPLSIMLAYIEDEKERRGTIPKSYR